MVFNSFEFLFLFLPAVLAIYFLCRESYAGNILVIASMIFYASWNWHYLPLLMASVAINYFVATKIRDSSRKKFWLLTGLIFDFGLLAYYKIINFLPLGISFWTFAQVGYLVEVFRLNVKLLSKPLSPLNYCEEILFFPVITSGPILDFKAGGGKKT